MASRVCVAPTLHGETHRLPDPFLVVATENPIEMEGTWPLPEAQLDRFLYKVLLASPSEDELAQVLASTAGGPPAHVEPVLDAQAVRRMRALTRQVPASSDLVRLVARLVRATHPDDRAAPEGVKSHVRYGASPRGGQAILWSAKARALCSGRLHVSEEDVAAVCRPALRHRLILSYEGEAAGADVDALVGAALAAVR